MTQCKYAQEGLCQISTLLAKKDVELDEATCSACEIQDLPKQINRVTCSRAIYVLRKANLPIPSNLETCIKAPSYGVGTELEKILNNLAKYPIVGRYFQVNKKKCGCENIKKLMNLWGYATVLKNRKVLGDRIVGHYLEYKPSLKPFKKFLAYLITICINKALHNHLQRCKKLSSNAHFPYQQIRNQP